MPSTIDFFGTITLNPKMYRDEPEIQYDNTCLYVRDKLHQLTNDFTLVAELTKAYNIHYHLVIKFDITNKNIDYRKEFHKLFRNDRMIGFINLQPMANAPASQVYIKKDLDKTCNSIDRRPVICDTYNWFNLEERALYARYW